MAGSWTSAPSRASAGSVRTSKGTTSWPWNRNRSSRWRSSRAVREVGEGLPETDRMTAMGTFRVRVGGVGTSGDLGAVTRWWIPPPRRSRWGPPGREASRRRCRPAGRRPVPGRPGARDGVREALARESAPTRTTGAAGASSAAVPSPASARRSPNRVRALAGSSASGSGGSTTHAARNPTDEEPMLDGPRQAEAGMAPAGGGRHTWVPVGYSVYGGA